MQLVIISSPDKFTSEAKKVANLFDCGLETFHVRKPKFSRRKMKQYLSMIPDEYHNRVIIHSHHRLAKTFKLKGVHITRFHKKRSLRLKLSLWWLKKTNPDLCITSSFHSLDKLMKEDFNYHYIFLSPIFESISKKGHNGSFPTLRLKDVLKKTRYKVFALGGVNKETIIEARDLGFSGMGLLGAVWNNNSLAPLEAYKEIVAIIKEGKPKDKQLVNVVTPVHLNIKKLS